VLTPPEADQLFAILRVLKAQGKTVLLITHKLREIMAITDRVSVMRRGEMVATRETAATSPAELAELMVGRRVLLRVDKGPARPGRPVLAVENLSVRDDQGVTRVEAVSFEVRAGEIVGIAGVAGNGQSELLEAIAGIRRPSSGRILIDGKDVAGGDAAAMRRAGLAHVPEDRLRMGLVKPFPAFESAILGYHHDARFGRGPLLSLRRMVRDLSDKMRKYDVRPQDPRLKTANFSGGNAQKIVLAREIERDPELLLVGQPTRGVDIGAIEFIHRQLIAMRDAGKAILLVSVELEEIMALSDRILVMCAGKITGERMPGAADEQELGLLMAGVAEQAA
jgi:general nucleoside transport system ATP-binding protein